MKEFLYSAKDKFLAKMATGFSYLGFMTFYGTGVVIALRYQATQVRLPDVEAMDSHVRCASGCPAGAVMSGLSYVPRLRPLRPT